MTVNWALMTDPATGRVALFDENGTTGSREDPNSAINAPLNSPASFLDKIRFHSDLDHFEVAFAGSTNVSYSGIAGLAVPSGLSSAFGYDAAAPTDDLLVTHGLGYEPFALVAQGSNIIWPGMPVQNTSDGGARYATAKVNTTELRVKTIASIGATALSATTLTYSYLVFKNPPAASGLILIDFDPLTGIVSMGLGKFSSDRPYLQVKPGGSPLGLSNGRTIDLNNGAFKAWRPDGTTYAPVPSMQSYLIWVAYGTPYTSILGNPMNYAGSYAGPASIQVQAP